MKPWVKYGLIRVAIFAIALTVLMLVGMEGWFAAILAAVIGLCVAYIFFRPQRDAVAQDLADRRAGKVTDPTPDEDAEDALPGT